MRSTGYVNCDKIHFRIVYLKVIYHPLYSMNKFVTNKSKLPQDEAHVFPYMAMIANHPHIWGDHVTL